MVQLEEVVPVGVMLLEEFVQSDRLLVDGVSYRLECQGVLRIQHQIGHLLHLNLHADCFRRPCHELEQRLGFILCKLEAFVIQFE